MIPFFNKSARHSPIVTAIIVAAGNGTRMAAEEKKQFMRLDGIPMIIHTLRAFDEAECITNTVAVTAEEDIIYLKQLLTEFGIKKTSVIVSGGATRSLSVRNGLNAALGADYAAIHDGARPCITVDEIERTVAAAIRHGAAALGIKATDTLKTVTADGFIEGTVDRSKIWQIQTPQCFDYRMLTEAYDSYSGAEPTDECMVAESAGATVAAVLGTRSNIKITCQDDLIIAEGILADK